MAMRSSSPPSMPTPGEVLRRLAEENHITQERLAESLGVSRYSVNQLMNGRRAVTAEMALRLARVLSTTAEFWLNLQRPVDLHFARQRIGTRVDRLKPLRRRVPDDILFYDA